MITFTLITVVLLGLAFDYVNGFHDSANSIATVVTTRALSPRNAVFMAAILNFIGAFMFEGVAKTVSKGIVEAHLVDNQAIILTALVGAITWNLLTWWWGLPSSSSHALVGGLVGSALVFRGFNAVMWYDGVWKKVLLPGLVSPCLGLFGGFLVMAAIMWIFRRARPHEMTVGFRYGQLFSASALSLAHGTNDAQKVMGIITLALVAGHVQHDYAIPMWVKFACALMMALGTAAGGWRIIKTMGSNLAKLTPVNGFAAQATASGILFSTAWLGMPVSTTHVISASIMGVGATRRLSAVRWTVAGRILSAWFVTLPAAASVSALMVLLLKPFIPELQ